MTSTLLKLSEREGGREGGSDTVLDTGTHEGIDTVCSLAGRRTDGVSLEMAIEWAV